MIPLSPTRLEPAQWQRDLAEAIHDPRELLALLGITPDRVPDLDPDSPFPLRVTRYFAGLMRPGDPNDPLLAQVLPRRLEKTEVAGFGTDPVGDLDALLGSGLLHKYEGRALAVTTGACAVHCRYCFRRHFPYAEQSLLRDWQASLDRLRGLDQVSELILSGGDPLTLADKRLGELTEDAQTISHLRRLRIHTRVPVVLPARVTSALCRLIDASRLQVVVVIHVNHPNEVSPELGGAMAALRDAGAILFNQAVLLKSVNDDADTLIRLSEALIAIGVVPYYLHLLDAVAGAAHFDVPVDQAIALMEALQARLPGYLVPRMVREVAGAQSKTPLAAC